MVGYPVNYYEFLNSLEEKDVQDLSRGGHIHKAKVVGKSGTKKDSQAQHYHDSTLLERYENIPKFNRWGELFIARPYTN